MRAARCPIVALLLVAIPALVVGSAAILSWAAGTQSANQASAAAQLPAGPNSAGVQPSEEILANSDIARQRMRRLITAYWIYVNDSSQVPEPHMLYPDYVSDPLDFWHPGDSDPPPTTIDNSVPNAPNSARISFSWNNDAGPLNDGCLIVRDNTPDNNGGLFINIVSDPVAFIETDPPLVYPTPTAVQLAQSRLHGLGVSMLIYANDYSDSLAQIASQLWTGTPCEDPRMFWNPGDSDPAPTDITNDVPNAANSAQISFDYVVGPMDVTLVTPDMVLMRDNTPDNNAGFGVNVLYGDQTVRFDPVGTLGDSNGDCHSDLADWAKFQRCHTGPDSPILDNTCRTLDQDGDDDIDTADQAAFVGGMTGPAAVIPACE